MRDESGFTLIEVMVVFAIMALVMSIVPMAFDRLYASVQYRDAVRNMISDLRVARQNSLIRHRMQRFNVDLNKRTYGLEGGVQHTIPDSLRVDVTVAATELQAGVAAIRFLPEGGATGGTISVVRTQSGTGVGLQVDWLSGSVIQHPL